MKNEILHRAISKIDNKLIIEADEQKKNFIKLIPAAAMLVLIITAAFTVPAIIKQNNGKPGEFVKIAETSAGTEEPFTFDADYYEECKSYNPRLTDREDLDKIMWSNSKEDSLFTDLVDIKTKKWNGLTLTDSFFDALQNAEDSALFAVTVKTTVPDMTWEDFIQTDPEYIALYEEDQKSVQIILALSSMLSDAMMGHNKSPYYGNMISQYIEEYGEDFFYRYYKDDEYDKDLLRADMEKYDNSRNPEYTKIYTVFLRMRHPNAYYFRALSKEKIDIYSLYSEDLDSTADFMILSKAELSELFQTAKDRNALEFFDFEHSCFSMVTYPEKELEQSLQTHISVPETEDPSQVPETEIN